MSTTTVTKSVRLSPEESEELARLSEQTAATEASLMKQWIREGMRAKRIGLAIQAYLERKADLRGAAAMAGVSYNRFLREVQARNIVILEDNGFLERLGFLADTFEDEDLRSTIRKVIRAEAGTP
jgi:predicted DNA-binding protein